MVRAQVTIIRRADRTDIRITPGGVAGDLLINTFGIARRSATCCWTHPASGHKRPGRPGSEGASQTAAPAPAGLPSSAVSVLPEGKSRMNRFVTSRGALRGVALMVVVAAVAGGCGSAARRPPRSTPPPSVVAAPVQVAHTPAGGVSYRSVGAGPPLLLITGYPFSMDDWPPVFVDILAEHYRVIIFDNAGVGQTALPPGPLTVSVMAGRDRRPDSRPASRSGLRPRMLDGRHDRPGPGRASSRRRRQARAVRHRARQRPGHTRPPPPRMPHLPAPTRHWAWRKYCSRRTSRLGKSPPSLSRSRSTRASTIRR